MNPAVTSAIQTKHLLEFYYENVRRVVEPHCYGRDTAGNDALCAWQLTGELGDRADWRFYVLSKISALRQLPESFDHARPGYKRGDKRMTTIYAQL
jgi:hypothetical protein